MQHRINFSMTGYRNKYQLIAIFIFIFVISFTVDWSSWSSCPSSVSSSNAIYTESDSFSGFSSCIGETIKIGPSSGSIYYAYPITSPDTAVVRRVSTDGTQTWMAAYQLTLASRSLWLDDSEQNVYIASYIASEVDVIRMYASTGAVVSVQVL